MAKKRFKESMIAAVWTCGCGNSSVWGWWWWGGDANVFGFHIEELWAFNMQLRICVSVSPPLMSCCFCSLSGGRPIVRHAPASPTQEGNWLPDVFHHPCNWPRSPRRRRPSVANPIFQLVNTPPHQLVPLALFEKSNNSLFLLHCCVQ